MSRFFVDEVSGDNHILENENAKHIIKSLRMKLGEKLILCDKNSVEYICVIEKIYNDQVFLKVLEKQDCISESNVKITLYQALPKSDKMDFIVQKSVELGAVKVVPVITERCVSRPDQNQAIKKVKRWQKISEEAAKQSGRGIIPQIDSIKTFNKVLDEIKFFDKALVFYEGGGSKIASVLPENLNDMAIFIGPEGGFSISEIGALKSKNAVVATLGKKILRTETASICALSILSYLLD